jgi:hypothetical protein
MKDIVLELSQEMEESNDDGPRGMENRMDQTIIIGEMKEGNIFDDLHMNRDSLPGPGQENTITISKEDLMEIIDNIKVQHRAEIDAIMLEQVSYKRIISQLLTQLKMQQAKSGEYDLKEIEFQKHSVLLKKQEDINLKQRVEI